MYMHNMLMRLSSDVPEQTAKFSGPGTVTRCMPVDVDKSWAALVNRVEGSGPGGAGLGGVKTA